MISVIITARNYSQFLPDAIKSVKKQTKKVDEIIYSDDCSFDDSVKIAKKLGVKIVTHSKHVGVVKARNNGADASNGDIILFLDGDDMLTPTFIEDSLCVFDEKTPYTYCSAKAFGDVNTTWYSRPWSEKNLYERNFVNTSALMWRWVFYKAGKWQDNSFNTMWDWDLSMRMAKFGTPRHSNAILLYRKHQASWSTRKRKGEADAYVHYENIAKLLRLKNVDLSIGLVYSGRLGAMFFRKWISQLVKDIDPFNRLPELIIVNNSGKSMPKTLKRYNKFFSRILIIKDDYKVDYSNEQRRRRSVSTFLSRSYNTILENCRGELLHLREDDIIPESGSFAMLLEKALGEKKITPAVAGLYLNRNPNRNMIVGGWYDYENPKRTKSASGIPSIDPIKVDFTGTGFILYWRQMCPQSYQRFVDGIEAHDWAWCLQLKQMGYDTILIPQAICRHYTTKKKYLLPEPDKMLIAPEKSYSKPKRKPQTRTVTKIAANAVNY